MKVKRNLLSSLAVVLLQVALAVSASAFSVMLPDAACTPPLPYVAEADHYGGPACVQMMLNTCPDVSQRHYNSQADIYSSILVHNAEPTMWFSDPDGIEGALEDPTFTPCGNWVDYSNTDKNYVLGKMLYYMNTQRYSTPVSITSNEHWVTVIGYQTDVEPAYSGSVTLQHVFFYDPNPGSASHGWVTGTIWLSSADYWGVPHSKAGSSWDNKYIAIIEPPELRIRIRVPEWILKGRILPLERIEEYVYGWLKEMRRSEVARGAFEILGKELKVKKPILVETGKYSYYLIPFEDSRLAAVFNAYDGSFEEFRYFQQPRRYVADPKRIDARLSQTLRAYRAKIIEASTPELWHDPERAPAGRFSPVWKVKAAVKDAKGKDHRLSIFLDARGEVISDLSKLGIRSPGRH